MNKYREEIINRINLIETELLLKCPDWYNPHDFASGHWYGRVGALHRELTWMKNIIEDLRDDEDR
jgi:hypothetical protein